ncbi:hypothetical protein TEA_002651 [Camellia sinensis var. sinensis]|uniref:Uncharacterized protein n=1 Tax=Camellia sinensis var. sinensis TaxID=542762 RepID=A0A4S4D9K8_CAMSN|nr:hypothetical protein TEA_002651 [Camellia sinensis var. sinensis]
MDVVEIQRRDELCPCVCKDEHDRCHPTGVAGRRHSDAKRQTFMPTKKDEASTSSRSCFYSAIVDEWLLLNRNYQDFVVSRPLDLVYCFDPDMFGMTKLCCLSNITGRKQWQRSSHMNSSGTTIWTRRLETRTISTGLSTSVRFFLHMKNCLLANEQDDVSFLSEAKIDFPGLFSSKFLCNSSGEHSSGSCLSFSFFCNSSDEEGTARVPFCSNPYSFLVFSSKLKNAGSLGPNSTTNLFGYSLLNAKTAKCPFTLSGTVNVAALVFLQNHLILAFYIAEV